MLQRLKRFYYRNFKSGAEYAKFIGVNIGEKCIINTRFFGTEPYLIKIGNNVGIANNTRFFTHTASHILRKEIPGFDAFGKIEIGNNVYIGSGCFIMPGVSIGNDCIVGGASVITKSFPDGVIIAGNPAKVIGNVSDFKEKMISYNANTAGLSYSKKKEILLSLPESKFFKK